MKRTLTLLLTLIIAFAPLSFSGAEESAPGEDIFSFDTEEDEETFEEEEDIFVFEPEEEKTFETTIDSYMLAERERIASEKSFLLIGIDARPREETGRSDTMIIVTLDTENNIIKLTSLMRDLYVEIPGYRNNRINASYVFGGPELLMQTIEANFGIHLENYIAVNFSMLASLIDSLGGLDLTVENDYYMRRINAVIKQDNKVLGINRNDGLLTQSGPQHMTGKQAQAYARYRYGTSDGDFGRTARQREVITKIFENLTGRSVIELVNLVVEHFDDVYTNMSLSDLVSFAPMMLSMSGAEITELRIPVDGAYYNDQIAGMSVLVPDREKNIDALIEFIGD